MLTNHGSDITTGSIVFGQTKSDHRFRCYTRTVLAAHRDARKLGI